jgi:hypothetical protein
MTATEPRKTKRPMVWRPIGVILVSAIVGGLLLSQFLTLYTTPVVYLALDKWSSRSRQSSGGVAEQDKQLPGAFDPSREAVAAE